MSGYIGSHSGLDRSVLIVVEQIDKQTGKTDEQSADHKYQNSDKLTNKH